MGQDGHCPFGRSAHLVNPTAVILVAVACAGLPVLVSSTVSRRVVVVRSHSWSWSSSWPRSWSWHDKPHQPIAMTQCGTCHRGIVESSTPRGTPRWQCTVWVRDGAGCSGRTDQARWTSHSNSWRFVPSGSMNGWVVVDWWSPSCASWPFFFPPRARP